ncbi:2-C-methyl-D-erythritol 4-phosphate cytidylyltransferase [Thiolapillus sp.]
MSYRAVVPAAGAGRRMGTDIPKQYLEIHGKAVIDWTLQALLSHPDIDSVMVALSAGDEYWSDTLSAADPRVYVVDGGEERCHSVLNALQALTPEAADDDWILVHDAARPCIQLEDVSRLMRLGSTGVGAVLGVPVHDTMKRTDVEGRIVETVERNRLWHAFTPQMFPLGLLRDSLRAALASGIKVTDEASAMEWAGYRPLMVEGAATNIKITRPADLSLAEFYLSL